MTSEKSKHQDTEVAYPLEEKAKRKAAPPKHKWLRSGGAVLSLLGSLVGPSLAKSGFEAGQAARQQLDVARLAENYRQDIRQGLRESEEAGTMMELAAIDEAIYYTSNLIRLAHQLSGAAPVTTYRFLTETQANLSSFYLINLTAEAQAQLDVLLAGGSLTPEEATALRAELETQIGVNQAQVIQEYNQLLANHPELLTIRGYALAAQEELRNYVNSQGAEISGNQGTYGSLQSTYISLSRQIDNLAPFALPAASDDFSYLERWFFSNWDDVSQYLADQTETSYYATDESGDLVSSIDIFTLSELDRENYEETIQLINDLEWQANYKLVSGSFLFLVSAAAFLFLARYQQTEANFANLNRHDGRTAVRRTRRSGQKLIGLLRTLQKKTQNGSQETKAKLQSLMSKVTDTLEKVTKLRKKEDKIVTAVVEQSTTARLEDGSEDEHSISAELISQIQKNK